MIRALLAFAWCIPLGLNILALTAVHLPAAQVAFVLGGVWSASRIVTVIRKPR